MHFFCYKQHFHNQRQAEAKQHPEAKLRLEINYFLHSRYHPKIIGDILKNVLKTSTPV